MGRWVSCGGVGFLYEEYKKAFSWRDNFSIFYIGNPGSLRPGLRVLWSFGGGVGWFLLGKVKVEIYSLMSPKLF